jgi:uncharacterized protein (TIGR02646 family)
MRRLFRPALKPALAAFLRRAQKEVRPESDLPSLWKRMRRRVAMRRIEETLGDMCGPRKRCMFCQDSFGTDVEHFRPKGRFREAMFLWQNLILACSGCNRIKSEQFPMGSSGEPLLIDPTAEDPWAHLVFNRETSLLTARWEIASGAEDLKGSTTLAVLRTLNYEAVSKGRGRIARALAGAVEDFLVLNTAREDADEQLRRRVLDNLDYGLAEWFFLREGQDEQPFVTLRAANLPAWAMLQAAVRTAAVG